MRHRLLRGLGHALAVRASGTGLRRVVVETLLITPSGALSPGPLSAAAVAVGASLGPLAGLAMALGHMVFELPYVALLTRWAGRLNRVLSRLEKPLNLAVAAFIVYFAVGLLAQAKMVLDNPQAAIAGASAAGARGLAEAFTAGLALTALNPYFLAWWATVGLPLVRGAASHGAKGFAAMYASHVWMDYAWLALLAAGGAGLARIAGLYAALLAGLAALLLAFAANMLSKSFLGRQLLPF